MLDFIRSCAVAHSITAYIIIILDDDIANRIILHTDTYLNVFPELIVAYMYSIHTDFIVKKRSSEGFGHLLLRHRLTEQNTTASEILRKKTCLFFFCHCRHRKKHHAEHEHKNSFH